MASFPNLKTALVNPPVLTLPRSNLPYVLDTDSCNKQLGCVLMQRYFDKSLRPIGYFSRMPSYPHPFENEFYTSLIIPASKDIQVLIECITHYDVISIGNSWHMTYTISYRTVILVLNPEEPLKARRNIFNYSLPMVLSNSSQDFLRPLPKTKTGNGTS